MGTENDNTATISFTPEMLRRLKAEHQRAKDAGETSFVFDGNDFLVSYAGYVIQFLDNQFKTQ